jgi:hypothetical protein
MTLWLFEEFPGRKSHGGTTPKCHPGQSAGPQSGIPDQTNARSTLGSLGNVPGTRRGSAGVRARSVAESQDSE